MDDGDIVSIPNASVEPKDACTSVKYPERRARRFAQEDMKTKCFRIGKPSSYRLPTTSVVRIVRRCLMHLTSDPSVVYGGITPTFTITKEAIELIQHHVEQYMTRLWTDAKELVVYARHKRLTSYDLAQVIKMRGHPDPLYLDWFLADGRAENKEIDTQRDTTKLFIANRVGCDTTNTNTEETDYHCAWNGNKLPEVALSAKEATKKQHREKEQRLQLEYKFKEVSIAKQVDDFYNNPKYRKIFESTLIPLMQKTRKKAKPQLVSISNPGAIVFPNKQPSESKVANKKSEENTPSQRALEKFFFEQLRNVNVCYFLSYEPVVYEYETALYDENPQTPSWFPFNLLDFHDTQVINVQRRFANPFRRRDKYEYKTESGQTLTTTICQLKYFSSWIEFGFFDRILTEFQKWGKTQKANKPGRKRKSESVESNDRPTKKGSAVVAITIAQNQQGCVPVNNQQGCIPVNNEQGCVANKPGKKYYYNGPSLMDKFYVFDSTFYTPSPVLDDEAEVLVRRSRADDPAVREKMLDGILFMNVSHPLTFTECDPLSYDALLLSHTSASNVVQMSDD